MKDYNYYKTIADICNERNDIYKKFMVEEIVPLNKTTLFREPEEGNSWQEMMVLYWSRIMKGEVLF